jgi:hypothetical protein
MEHHKDVHEITENGVSTKSIITVPQQVQSKILHFNFFNSHLFGHGSPYWEEGGENHGKKS